MRKRLLLLVYLLIMGMAFAVPTRSNLAAKEIATLTIDSGFSAKDYIQDGLVAMWDAKENVGWGMHDANATNWIDLTGNGHNLLTLAANGWINGNGRLANKQCTGLQTEFIESDISTISVACEHLAGNIYVCILLGVNNRKVARYNSSSGARFICQNRRTYSPAIDYNDLNSFTLEYDFDTYEGYSRNLGWFGDTPCTTYLHEYVNDSRIFIGFGGYSARSIFYCIRIYNRFLSQEEISYNWAIDKARFNLSD